MTGKLFGTTGVRKLYGSEFDLGMALKLGKALGTYLGEGSVLMARDVRTTSRMIEDALTAGILSTGVNVIRAGMIPTPTLAFMTKHLQLDAGVMVTASHNPPEYTGVKFWASDTMGFKPEDEAKLEELYNGNDFRVAAWDNLGDERFVDNAVGEHIEALVNSCDAELIRSKNFKVIVDPGNGAACVLTPYLVQRLGCHVITINGQPDGHFPGRKSEPEEETLGDLIRLVKETSADLGIAHDGDSDRVVFVTNSGEVIRGDRTIALLSREILKVKKGANVVTTVDSSKVLDETVVESGGKAVRTPVGDIQVAIKLREINAAIGGEACGVYIFPEFQYAPEPFLAICKVLELMANTGRSFGDLISEIPIYPILRSKVNVANEKKEVVMNALSDELPKVITDTTEVLTVDGLGLSLKQGWILVRPSGTEPVIRITCEAQTNDIAESILAKAKTLVEKVIQKS
ncbi:MAG: phosphoglucosamine mutase [Candidatus Thorarchaeota archaeon]|jgi:phosphoglucosamine mutase